MVNKMTRLAFLLGLGLLTASLPQMTTAQSATLEPGLYDVSNKVVMTGRVVRDEVVEDCIRAGENDKTLQSLLLDFTKKDECGLNNVEQTASTMRADFTCPPLQTGGDVGGTIEAKYASDSLIYTLDWRFGPISRVTVNKDLRRKAECPVK